MPENSTMATPAEAFARLVDIMATLRGPEGCPWDREQTFRSLSQFVLEEAYERSRRRDRTWRRARAA
jgi:uncharacterized protein YabN with tetrapyrrole methylase and pyrophosphatase domain